MAPLARDHQHAGFAAFVEGAHRCKKLAPEGAIHAVEGFGSRELEVGDTAFDVANADAACQYIIGQGVFAELERPITAACAVADGDSFQIAIADA